MLSLHRTLNIFVCTALIGIASVTHAARYDSALNAYARGDYNNAFMQFNKLSNQNTPYAQYMLGKMYMTGEGGAKDYLLAFKWLSLAAENGVVPARKLKQQIQPHLSIQEKRWVHELTADQRNLKNGTGDFIEYSDPVTVRRIQDQLARLDFFHAQVDGIMGPKTRQAIRRYQKAHHLEVDGTITVTLVEKMNIGPDIHQKNEYLHPHITQNVRDNEMRQRLKKPHRPGA